MRTEPVPSIDKNNIHFIWFGAAMHAKAVDTVKQWRAFLDAVQKAHDTKFEISIWVDKVGSSPEAIKQMEQEFAGIATLRDVTELGFSDDIVRYQIDRLRPNYAASSDVVRFRILKKERGLYLDTDIVPPTSIDHFMKAWSHDDVIMPNQFAAQQGILNSDVIFYNGKNPHSFIDYMVDETVKNYDVKAQDSSLSRKSQHRYKLAAAPESSAWQQAYLQETDQHRLEYTLRVGSSLLMSDWLEQQFQATGGPAQNIEDMVKRAGYTLVAESDLRTPLDQTGSDLSWRGRPVIQLDTVDEAVVRAVATMQFEVEHQGVLRLDDHLMNIIESVADLGYEESEIINELLARFDEVLQADSGRLLKQVNVAQLTFRFDEVLNYYRDNGLLSKTGLLETSGDTLNFNAKAIIQRAAQPFEGMHLAGQAQKHEARGEIERANIVQAQYNQKLSSAHFGFLKGLVTFYFQQCQAIDVDQQIDQHSQMVLTKSKENLTTVYHELSKFAATAPQATAALQEQITEVSSFIDKVRPYREYQESTFFSSRGFFGMFSSPEKPSLTSKTAQPSPEYK